MRAQALAVEPGGMTRPPITISSPAPLYGILAVAVAFAWGLLTHVTANPGPPPAPEPPAAVAGVPTNDHASLGSCRHGLPPAEALSRGRSGDSGADPRRGEGGPSLHPPAAAPGTGPAPSNGLAAVSASTASSLSLRVLFCSWLN
jgi:hypothetical protein